VNFFLIKAIMVQNWLIKSFGLFVSCLTKIRFAKDLNNLSSYSFNEGMSSYGILSVKKLVNSTASLLGVIGLLLISNAAFSQAGISVTSPNKKIEASIHCRQGSNKGEWFLSVGYINGGNAVNVIPAIDLGLLRSDQGFAKELKFQKVSKPRFIKEKYTAIHGKKSVCENRANEIRVSLTNPSSTRIDVVIRAYDDGLTFRYEFPGNKESFKVDEELTAYTVSSETTRWMEKWNPANEGLYTQMNAGNIQQQEWCYPALFKVNNSNCWFMLHEADLNSSYCGSKLSNKKDVNEYQIAFPDQKDGRGQGESKPTITLPWKSPWRVVMVGSLQDIVASTLTDDVSPASVLKNAEWVQPGKVSWNYWSSNHGTKDYKIVTAFADLAARMNWPYTLLDWEWDSMSNGGNVEDAAKYALSKKVKPLIWYNSGGNHTWVSSTPKDRMLTHESRLKEFAKLSAMGFVGVKIDFFESEKQQMIAYYLDILADAAACKMLVYFHGCVEPRGWSRTYPNLMTYEAVRGAEWYNNGPQFTSTAPVHNTTLPFTRNVIGPMDYTPVTFTNSQFPHITSYGHELALSVMFESGLQHFADRPEGYDRLPEPAKQFLKDVPVAWDETRLLDGFPGRNAFIARKKGETWYMAGISAESADVDKTFSLNFLSPGVSYKATIIADGDTNTQLATRYTPVNSQDTLTVKMLSNGGFSAVFTPLNK
jgi:alpha-glucosidase